MKINKSLIFTIVGTLLIPAVAYVAAKDGVAAEKAKEKLIADNPKATKKDIFAVKAKCYWKTAILCGAAMGCGVAAGYTSEKAVAVAAGGSIIAKQQLERYRDGAIALGSEELDRDIRQNAISSGAHEQLSKIEDKEKVYWFHDGYSGDWFKARLTDVILTQYEANRSFVLDSRVSYNSIRRKYGLDPWALRENFGWSAWDDVVFGHVWIDFENRKLFDRKHGEYYEIIYSIPPYDFKLRKGDTQ